MKKIQIATLAALGIAALQFAGCGTTEATTTTQPVSKSATYVSNAGTIETDEYRLEKSVPDMVAIGDDVTYTYKLTAKTALAAATLKDSVPSAASFVSGAPAGAVSNSGSDITWSVGKLAANETKTATVTLKANSVGTLTNCATVLVTPAACTTVTVGQPLLQIVKTVPQEGYLVGDTVPFTVTVKNNGTYVAKGVVVTDKLPAGLTAVDGQALSFSVGDLAPNESKSFTVAAKATAKGKFCNGVSVAATNAKGGSAEACVVIRQPGLNVLKTGTKEQIIGKVADYTIKVENTGDVDLTNVVLVDTAPAATQVRGASNGGTVSGNTVSWTIASLPAGKSQEVTVSLISKTPGTHCNDVTATAGALSSKSQACTNWIGRGAILLEVVDEPDALLVGETTTYTIKITNQGTVDITNISLIGKMPTELDATAVSDAGTISGKNVTFPIFGPLAPGATKTLTISAKAVKAGDGRLAIELKSSLNDGKPVNETESTNVY